MVCQNRVEDPLLTFILQVTEGQQVEVPDNPRCQWISTSSGWTQSHQEVDVNQILERSDNLSVVPTYTSGAG